MLPSSEQVSNDYLHINHCGIEYLWDKDYSMLRSKGRMDYHILYIAQGRCYTEILGQAYTVEAGGLIYFAPGETQKYAFCAADKPISCYLHFSGTGCAALIERIGLGKEHILDVGKSKTLEAIFEKMIEEKNLNRPFCDSLCAAYLLELFSMMGRKIALNKNPVYRKNKSRVDAVCAIMHEEYARSHPLERYAKDCHLSVSRFSHIFKQSTGLTPVEYINQIRVGKAKDLLLNTDLPMSEIAERVGFSNQNYFGRVFKKYTGMAPKRYALEEGALTGAK